MPVMKLLQRRHLLASTLVPAIFGQSSVETMKAERLISCAVLDPDKAEMLVRAFDESWASIARNHADDPRVIERSLGTCHDHIGPRSKRSARCSRHNEIRRPLDARLLD